MFGDNLPEQQAHGIIQRKTNLSEHSSSLLCEFRVDVSGNRCCSHVNTPALNCTGTLTADTSGKSAFRGRRQ